MNSIIGLLLCLWGNERNSLGTKLTRSGQYFVRLCTAFLFQWTVLNHEGWYSFQECLICVHLIPKSSFCTRKENGFNLCHLWWIINNSLEYYREIVRPHLCPSGRGLRWVNELCRGHREEVRQSTAPGFVIFVWCSWGRHRKGAQWLASNTVFAFCSVSRLSVTVKF